MKRKMFLLGSLALIVAGSIFWSCQKDELIYPEDGVMLKSASTCCVVTATPTVQTLSWTGGSTPQEATLTIWNDNSKLYVKVEKTSGRATWDALRIAYPASDQVGDHVEVSTNASTHTQEYNLTNFDCDDLPILKNLSIRIEGPGTFNITAYSHYLEVICDDCTNWDTQTAFGGEVAGGGSAWWFYYDGEGEQTIWAGQTIDVGTVEYISSGEMVITLKDGWELNPINVNKEAGLETENTEPVKIQGYTDLPSDRPAAGLFTTYKGTDLSPAVGEYAFYVIHLDVRKCAD